MLDFLKQMGLSSMINVNDVLMSLKKDLEQSINKPVKKFNLVYMKKSDFPFNWFFQVLEETTQNGKLGVMQTIHEYKDGDTLMLAVSSMLEEQNISIDNLEVAALKYDEVNEKPFSISIAFKDAEGNPKMFETVL